MQIIYILEKTIYRLKNNITLEKTIYSLKKTVYGWKVISAK